MNMETRIMARIQGETTSRGAKKAFSTRRPDWSGLTQREDVARDLEDVAKARARMTELGTQEKATLEKFGGDSLGEARANHASYLARLTERGLW